jgi:hypothetical protein
MYVDEAIVLGEASEQARQLSAEVVEGRASAKGSNR